MPDDPDDLEAELERDPLVAVHLALEELADDGRPVDADRLRALITAASDQADAHAANVAFSDRSRSASAWWAELYRALLPAVDALEAGEVLAARQAIRAAMYPDDPDPFDEALAILRRHRDGEPLDEAALKLILPKLEEGELELLFAFHRPDPGEDR